jgi:hypothetical protein
LVEETEEWELMDVSIIAAIDGLEDDVCLMDVDFLFGALSGWRRTREADRRNIQKKMSATPEKNGRGDQPFMMYKQNQNRKREG